MKTNIKRINESYLSEMELQYFYDIDVDVLYISFGKPLPSKTHQDKDGLLWRTPYEEDKVKGVTIINFQHTWKAKIDMLSSKISKVFFLSKDPIKNNLEKFLSPSCRS